MRKSRIPCEISNVPMGGTEVKQAIPVAIAIAKANQRKVELIIIVRGGGITSEDQLNFSSLEIAQAIAASSVPVWTALGHTRDRFLIDHVADNCLPNTNVRHYFSAPSDAGKTFSESIIQTKLSWHRAMNDIFSHTQIRIQGAEREGKVLA